MASSRPTSLGGSIGGMNASANGGASQNPASNMSLAEQLMQLDQAITLTLQDVDANLSAAHQVVTDKLLPAVKRYGVASARTWQGAKFWLQFFEEAAGISIGGTSSLQGAAGEEQGAPDVTESDLLNDGDDVSQSQLEYDQDDEDEDIVSPVRGEGAASRARLSANDAGADNGDDGLDDSIDMATLRQTLPVSSSRHYGQVASTNTTSRPRQAQASTTPRSRHAKYADDSLDSRARGHDTPEARPLSASVRVLNAEASAKRWDGIADLRNTPLNARGKRFGARVGAVTGSKRISTSPRKAPTSASQYASSSRPRTGQEWSDEDEDTYDDVGDSLQPLPEMSPPHVLPFNTPRSRYRDAPPKEVAQLVVDDMLRTIDGMADPLALAEQTRRERASIGGGRVQPSSSRQAVGVVGTPLRKEKAKSKNAKNRGRDSLPTPPTLTKLPPRPLASYIAEQALGPAQASTTPLAAPDVTRATGSAGSNRSVMPGTIGQRSNAGRVMDEGEDEGAAAFDLSELQPKRGTPATAASGTLAPLSSERISAMLNAEDEDSDSQSESDDDDDDGRVPSYPATASKSTWTVSSAQASSGGSRTGGSKQGRSIEDDTLFGVRPLPSSSAGASSLRLTAGPMQNPFAKPAGAGPSNAGAVPSYKAIDSTVHGGRSLIGADRSDTYSAPSPTPFGASGGGLSHH